MRFRLAFVATILISGVTFCRPAAASSKPLEGRVVVLDPGHAVKNDAGKIINPGAKGSGGVLERDVNLRVVETIAPLLEAQGAKVYRYSYSQQADNRGRAILANMVHADAYIRIHSDWNRDKRFKGFTTFFYRWGSRPLAEAVHDALAKSLPGHRDNGIKRRSFVSASAHMPAVLIELGVLSNKVEGKELMQEEHDSHLAMAVTEGIIEYFQKHKS